MFFFGFYRVVPFQTILSDYGTITMVTPLMYFSTSGTPIYNILSLLTKKKNKNGMQTQACCGRMDKGHCLFEFVS